MSFRMTNWAYTHSLKAGLKLLLVTIADKAHDDGTTPAGLEYLSYETDIPLPTLKRYMRQLREMDLLHTERREYKGFGGRLTNLIVLHPWVEGAKPSWYDYQKLRAEAAVTEQKFGTEVPVENSEPTQGINLIPSSNSGADAQSINLIPCAHKVSNEPTQGINSDNFEGGALKERARGFNHQLINHQSVSQSVKSLGPVENSDGLTDRRMKIENSKNPQPGSVPAQGQATAPQPNQTRRAKGNKKPAESPQGPQGSPEASFVSKSSPTAVLGSQWSVQGSAGSEVGTAGPGGSVGVVAARGSEAAERFYRGVDLERVKATLHHAGIPATSIPAATFVCMIDLVLDRATTPIKSPNGYVTAAMKNGWGELLSKAQSQPGNGAGASSAAVCRQHRCHLSPAAGECKRCIAEQRAAELDEVQHELTWKQHLNQIDVATLEVSLRRAGCSVDALPVPVFGQRIMDALADGVSATTQGLYEFFKNHQEIFKTPVSGSAGIRV